MITSTFFIEIALEQWRFYGNVCNVTVVIDGGHCELYNDRLPVIVVSQTPSSVNSFV